MKIIQLLQERVGFTKNELLVLMFLASALLAGMAVRLLGPGPARTVAPRFDFSRSDTEFTAGNSPHRPGSGGSGSGLVAGYPPPGSPGGAGSISAPPQPGPKITPPPGSININAAGAAELRRLPGIGPALAERILAFRAGHGRFRSIDGLSAVRGIGPKKLEKLRPCITLR
jgi:competence protein ComEA